MHTEYLLYVLRCQVTRTPQWWAAYWKSKSENNINLHTWDKRIHAFYLQKDYDEEIAAREALKNPSLGKAANFKIQRQIWDLKRKRFLKTGWLGNPKTIWQALGCKRSTYYKYKQRYMHSDLPRTKKQVKRKLGRNSAPYKNRITNEDIDFYILIAVLYEPTAGKYKLLEYIKGLYYFIETKQWGFTEPLEMSTTALYRRLKVLNLQTKENRKRIEMVAAKKIGKKVVKNILEDRELMYFNKRYTY